MFIISHRRRQPASQRRLTAPRRGVALVFVMVFVIAMAALAMSSIFMSSGSTLLAKSYDRERDLRFAAEVALSVGKSRLIRRPGLLVLDPGTNFRAVMTNEEMVGADNLPIPGIRANVYIGLTGSSSGQNGRFVSIVAQAVDVGTKSSFIRRLELTQESFAKYAYWSNSESNNGATIYFNNGDQLWGPVWSNDVINIGSGTASFSDQVGTAKSIVGKVYGKFAVPPLENQTPIQLPSTAVLGVLSTYAGAGGTVSSGDAASADENQVRDRIEFVPVDMDNDGSSSGTDEGFYRWYQAIAGNEAALRGDWVGTVDRDGLPAGNTPIPPASAVERCGDWHYMPMGKANNGNGNGNRILSDTGLKFYPASVHSQQWFHDQIRDGTAERMKGVLPAGFVSYQQYADTERVLTLPRILSHPGARCYLAGDPHLAAADRVDSRGIPLGSYSLARDVWRGGEDTTFTPVGRFGRWIAPAAAPAPAVLAARPKDGRYLYAISHAYNPGSMGVIYATGNVGISGVVNGLVTVYTPGSIVILDDVRYSNDPVTGACRDILGLISGFDVVIADNAINTPVALSVDPAVNYGFRSMHATPSLVIHAVAMTLGTSFRVQDYDKGPRSGVMCGAVAIGRGCIDLSGGIIQVSRGAVGTSIGTGYTKRYTYDRCAVRNPPPYFPTTGRFADNRYLELDPAGFRPDVYFNSLIPRTP